MGAAEKLFILHPEVVREHGGKKVGAGYWVMRCPVHADSTPSLSIQERGGQVLFHCHAGCSGRDVGRALIALGVMSSEGDRMRSLSPRQRKAYRRRMAQVWQKMREKNERLDRKREYKAWRIWESGLQLSVAQKKAPEAYRVVMRYFECRGIPESAVLRFGRDSLRVHPALLTPSTTWEEHGKQKLPTVLAAIRRRRWVVGIHRTYLTEETADQGKAWKRAVFGSTKGNAIQLGQLSSDLRQGVLGIAEGIETAMTMGLAFPEAPFWSVISAGGIATFGVPPWVKRLIVAVDMDQPKNGQTLGAGPMAVDLLRARLRKERPDVEIREVYPAIPVGMTEIPSGYDWNDSLRDLGPKTASMEFRRQVLDWMFFDGAPPFSGAHL